MAAKRAKQRDIRIPPPLDLSARIAVLESVEEFLKWCFPSVFSEPFTESRLGQIYAIVDTARYGGDQATADSRGEGKTTTAMHVALWLMIRGISTFPIIIGKAQKKSQAELEALKNSLQGNERLSRAFPEIAIPFEKVGKWSSRARMQTLDGASTGLAMKTDHFIFPNITAEQLVKHNRLWEGLESVATGQIMVAVGVDGPIRGTKVENKRPTIAIIDDMEDREAANSDSLIEKNEEILEQDIGGLGQSSERISRVMLCTIQNRKCIAYKYTDPKLKPSWRGKRFRKMITKPDRMDLVDQYVEMRRNRTMIDPDARDAFRFWRDNQQVIEQGCVISNPYSHSKKIHSDGEPIELSAIQSYFNRVADMGEKAVATEIDNDPPETAGPQGVGLTAQVVASRLSGLQRRQLPANTIALTAAIDLGKYRCHWVVTAWWSGGGGVVADYGVAEVTGTASDANEISACEPHIYRALLAWRDDVMNRNYTDATGTIRKIDFCLVDSGMYQNAAYEFCRECGSPFHPSKGIANYRPRKSSSDDVIASANLHAQKFASQKVWLYELNTAYWKQWVHERFLTPTFNDQNMLRSGSLSLFELPGNQKHQTYSHHITAEELLTEFREGKGVKTYWHVANANNHWLDATYMAAAGSEVCGVKLFGDPAIEVQPRTVNSDERSQKQVPSQRRHSSNIRQRPGGWMQGIKRSR